MDQWSDNKDAIGMLSESLKEKVVTNEIAPALKEVKNHKYNFETEILNTGNVWNNDSKNGESGSAFGLDKIFQSSDSGNIAEGLELDLGNIMLETHNLESPAWKHADYDGVAASVNDNNNDWKFFVFDEREIDSMLQLFVRDFRADKPALRLAPSKLFYLASRFAFFYMPKEKELGTVLLNAFLCEVNQVTQQHPNDMVLCVQWLANVSLLLFYLKKDNKLDDLTVDIQNRCSELMNSLYITICQDAMRRMNENLEEGMVKYTGIQGLEDILRSRSWNLLRRRPTNDASTSPRSTPSASPRSITKIIASTLHLLEVFYIHPLIRAQCIEQLFSWLGARLFNIVISNKKYLSRAAAMETRFNISSLEEWSQTNSPKLQKPFDYPDEDLKVDLISKLLSLVQLLQWLQCLYRLSEDEDPRALQETLESLDALNPRQIYTAAKLYRPDITETKVSKTFLKKLDAFHEEKLREKIDSSDKGDVSYEFELLKDETVFSPLKLPTKAQLINAYSYIVSGNGFNEDRKIVFQPHVSNILIDKLEENGLSMERAELPTSVFEDELQRREWRPDQEVEELLST